MLEVKKYIKNDLENTYIDCWKGLENWEWGGMGFHQCSPPLHNTKRIAKDESYLAWKDYSKSLWNHDDDDDRIIIKSAFIEGIT